MVFPAIMAGVSLLSGLSGARKQKKLQQEMLNYQRSLRLDPVTGRFGQIGVTDGNVTDLGIFGDLQSQFGGAAGDVLGGIDFSGGLPPEIADAMGLLRGNLSPNVNPMLGGLNRIGGQAGMAGDQALADLFSGNPNASLMSQLFGGASGLAGQVGGSFQDVRDSTLATLRASAAPEQQRAVDSTLSRLFAQGRLGSTGGANIIGRLAEAQNQQDLGFQLSAGNEARAASQDVASRFQALLGGGLNLNAQDQSRVANAFQRFSGSAGIGADVNQAAFSRMAGLESEGFNRILQNLQSTVGAAGLPTQLQGDRLGLATQLLGSSTGIQDLLRGAFSDALGKSQASTNVKVAGAGLATNYAGGPNFSASPGADFLQSFSSGFVKPGSIDFASIFGNLGKKTDPASVFASLGIPN